jgi:hypothetical protein
MPEFEDIRDRLLRALQREIPSLRRNDDYFEGEQPLKYLSAPLQEQLGLRLSPIVLNLARFGVEVYENRLDIEGFRFPGTESSDDALWTVWEHNDGPLLSQQAHREGLALGRAYTVVGEGDDDVPLITAESPFEAIHEDDPRTHEVRYGIKKWSEVDGEHAVNLYHPNGRITWRKPAKRGAAWVQDGKEENDFNLCRLVPLPNDPRGLGRFRPGKFDQRLGRAVFHDIVPVMDALNKIASDMMVSAEFHAMPRRWATGLNKDDFVDAATGEQMKTFELIAGRMWGVEGKDVKFGQFPEAELTNFHNTIKLLMQLASQLLGLPPHYAGFNTDNPASADAIRSSEAQLVKRAERKQAVLSSRWERVQRLVLLTQGKRDTPESRRIETLWRDPSTPTIAQKADAIVKLVATKDSRGHSLVDVEQAREDLGYTPTQRGRMQERDGETTEAALGAAVQAAVEAERGDAA